MLALEPFGKINESGNEAQGLASLIDTFEFVQDEFDQGMKAVLLKNNYCNMDPRLSEILIAIKNFETILDALKLETLNPIDRDQLTVQFSMRLDKIIQSAYTFLKAYGQEFYAANLSEWKVNFKQLVSESAKPTQSAETMTGTLRNTVRTQILAELTQIDGAISLLSGDSLPLYKSLNEFQFLAELMERVDREEMSTSEVEKILITLAKVYTHGDVQKFIAQNLNSEIWKYYDFPAEVELDGNLLTSCCEDLAKFITAKKATVVRKLGGIGSRIIANA